MTTAYIRNRTEAALVAKVARECGRKTSIRDIYRNDRYLINVAERLFGADPSKTAFVIRAQQAIMEVRAM